MKKCRTYIKDLLYLVVGNLGYALAFNFFYAPHDIAAGGFGGMGVVASHFLPISVGTFVMIISVPVLIWSFVVQGPRYTASALLSTTLFSVFVDITDFLPCLTDNRLLAVLCGGACFGVSAAILIKGRVSGSGTDLLARLIVTRFRSLSLGSVLFICDAFVVLLSVVSFGNIETGIYSAGAILVSSWVMDEVIRGLNRACQFQIITKRSVDELAGHIYERLDRGVTLIPARGAYRNEEYNMLLVAVRPGQVYDMKDVIREYAPEAFVMLLPANEILGEGFSGLDVTIPIKDLDNK